MGDIQFDRVPAIAPAGEPHVRNSSDAPARQHTPARQPAKPPRSTDNPEDDATNDLAANDDPGVAADDTEAPHVLDRFA